MSTVAKNSLNGVDVTSNPGRKSNDDLLSKEGAWKAWKSLVAISTFFSLICTSFLGAFHTSVIPLVAISYICDGIYLIDTAIRIKKCVSVSKKKDLSNKALATMWCPLAVDIITLLPIEFIAVVKVTPKRPWLYVSRLYRLNRIARFYRFFVFCRELENKQGANILAIKAFKHIFVTLATLHLIACGWYLLGCEPHGIPDSKCYPSKWAALGDERSKSKTPGGGGDGHGHGHGHGHKRKRRRSIDAVGTNQVTVIGIPIPKMKIMERYIVCLYWSAITATSTGYGDVHAAEDYGKLYSIVCMMIGVVFFFGTVLGDMGSAITNSDNKRAAYKHKLDAVLQYLKQRNVQSDMKKAVCGFYEYIWGSNGAVGRRNIFDELPVALKAELSLSINNHVLDKVPLFKDTALGIKRMLSMHIEQKTYFPGQWLFRENDVGHSLYYVQTGEVQIFESTNEKAVKTFKEGSYFGEISLVMNVPRPASARAVTYCEILTLHKTVLNNVIRHFPKEFDTLRSAIQQRYQQADMDSSSVSDILDSENPKESDEEDAKDWRLGLKQLYNDWIISPSSSFYKIWRVVIFCTSLIFFVVHTAIASYKISFFDLGYGDNAFLTFLYALWYIYDLLLIIDIFIDARTEINKYDKGIVNDPKVIRELHMTSFKFWIDIASVIPLEIAAAVFPVKLQWYAATVLRSNRLIRIYHIPHFFDMLEKDINYNILLIRPFKLVLYILLTTHISSCVWFLQACSSTRCTLLSWASKTGINSTHTDIFNYVISVYWSCATMTSTGYGDITAMSRHEEVVAMLITLIGLLLYGYCVCNIYSTLIHLLAPRTFFLEEMNATSRYLKDLNLCPDMIREIKGYFGFIWKLHRGQSIPGRMTLISDMPLSLQENVTYEQFKEILQDVPLFRDTGEEFQKKLSLIAKTFLFMPGETIARIGDMSRSLYIVRRGKAEVLSADRSCVVATFGQGGYFGEVALLYGESRPSDVRAKTYCEIVVFTKKDLDGVLKDFPVVAKELEHISDNIGVLQKLQAAAHEEAKRTALARGDNPLTKYGIISEGCGHPSLCKTKARNRRESIRFSLPARIRLNSVEYDAILNPECRRLRISLLDKEEQQEYYSRLNPVVKILTHLLLKKHIAPDSRMLKLWITVTTVMAYIQLLLVAIHVAFTPESTISHVISYVVDAFFLVDMYIKFHVGFYNEEGVLITYTVKTAEQYLRTSFIFDFIALIPFDAFLLSSHAGRHYGKVNRLFHFVKVVKYFSFYSSPIGRKYDLIRLLGMCSYLALIMHYFACAWFYISCSRIVDHALPPVPVVPKAGHGHGHGHGHLQSSTNGSMAKTGASGSDAGQLFKCEENSWARKYTNINIMSANMGVQYTVCIYWAISTLCSVGYGDVHAYAIKEMILSCVAMITGVLCFGYVIAYIFASISSTKIAKSKFQDDLDGVKQFLISQEVEPTLRQRVLSQYDHVWQRTQGIDVMKFLEGLPSSMQGCICFSLFRSMLYSVPVFQDAPVGFIEILAQFIKPMYILTGEYITKRGDMARDIFFLHFGNAEIVDTEEFSVKRKIGKGHFFGEIGVICNGPVYTSIRALTNADLFVLPKEDLDIALNNFPQIKQNVTRYAEETKMKFDEQSFRGVVGFDVQKFEGGIGNETEKNSTTTDSRSKSTPERRALNMAIRADNEIGQNAADGQNERRGSGLFATIRHWNRFVIRGDNPLRYIRTVNAVGMYFICLVITFMPTYCEYRTSFWVVSYIWEALFMFEIYLNFHMSYKLQNLDEVEDYDLTFSHYLKGEFIYDAIANFPLDLLCFAFPAENRLEFLAYLRLIHMLRLRRVRQLFSEWLSHVNINLFFVTLFKDVSGAFIFIHVLSCIWYVLACPRCKCKTKTWISISHTHADPFSRHFDSFYWAVATMTSTGYGDIYGTHTVEMLFCVLVMVSGKFMFGFVLSSVTAALSSTEGLRSGFEEKVREVQAYMRGEEIQPSLQDRVLRFFKASWTNTRSIDTTSVLLKTPFCLRSELYFKLIGDIVLTIPVFEQCGKPFIRHLCSTARYHHFCYGEYITRCGDIDENLYIIKRGEVQGIVEDTGEDGAESAQKYSIEYKTGDFFGEENIIVGRPSALSIKAKTDTDVFIFSKSAVHYVINIFQNSEDLSVVTAEKFRQVSISGISIDQFRFRQISLPDTSKSQLECQQELPSVSKEEVKWQQKSSSEVSQGQVDSQQESPSDVSNTQVESKQESPLVVSKTQVESQQESPLDVSKTQVESQQESSPDVSKTQVESQQESPLIVSKTQVESQQESPLDVSKTRVESQQESPSDASKTQVESQQESPLDVSETQVESQQELPPDASKDQLM